MAPSDDILRGFANKCGVDCGTNDAARRVREANGFWTPIRLRNELLAGTIPVPTGLILDEAHHSEAGTYDILHALTGACPLVGLTATPYRGTSRSSAEFREFWGEPYWIIKWPDAVEKGIISMPHCEIVPLLDDDVVEVKSGEFVVEQLDQQITLILDRVRELLSKYHDGTRYDRPTMLALPSVALAESYAANLGLPCVCVTGETSPEERERAFAQTLECTHALVQIRVVSEGVDLPIRRLIDLTPCMSPVKWLQQFGRITRPGGTSHYICTNRNILRHSYLLEGLMPVEVLAQAEGVFGISERTTYRAIGFEGLGKFQVTAVPMTNGTSASLVCISKLEDNLLVQYAALCSPAHADVLYAKKVSRKNGDHIEWGRWELLEALPDLQLGFTSVFKGKVTEKQRNWWLRDAARYGLNPDVEPNNRTFQALAILSNTNWRKWK